MKRICSNSRNTAALGLMLLCLAGGVALAEIPAANPENGPSKELKMDPFSLRGPDPKDQFTEIIIDQKLNQQVPLDLEFKNEAGETVKLADYFGEKPVVLSLVYYECPMLCNLVLNGMVAAFDAATNKLSVGKDYEVLTVSIDPGETPALAVAKKESYLKQYHREGGAEGWHFLTGTQDNIEDLAQAVGFRYYYDQQTDQFAHASGIMILTPEGRVSSYYLGIEYMPRNFELALIDAGKGAIGTLADQLVLLCYAYDPSKGQYGFLIFKALRLGAGGIVLFVLSFWAVHYLQQRRKARRQVEESPGHA